jgi:tripeptidyl-peptidase I
MALGARGISVLFSSGDGGVRNGQCDNNTFVPIFPASCPYVTAIGATFSNHPEVGHPGSGGGFSNIFSRPSYQGHAVSTYLDSLPSDFAGLFNRGGRGYPDAAFQGVNFEFAIAGKGNLLSGTSASSPGIASIIALINDRLMEVGRPQLGFLNPFLYGIGALGFTDIVSGNNTGSNCNESAVSLMLCYDYKI